MRSAGTFGLLIALALGAGCAGSDDAPVEDSGTPPPEDTGTPPPIDTSPPDPPPDTSPPPPTCEDDEYADACESATDLGIVMEGDVVSPPPGLVIAEGEEDWYRVDFPPNPDMNTPGGGAPTIEFAVNEGDAYRIEVKGSCEEPLVCGDGMSAIDVIDWSFVDDQSMEGDEQWNSRDALWPESVIFRVYRPEWAADCQRYRLNITR
jgi:hypothetical protein